MKDECVHGGYVLCHEESSRELKVQWDRPHGNGRGGDGGQEGSGEWAEDGGGGSHHGER